MFCFYTLPLARPAQAKIQMLTAICSIVKLIPWNEVNLSLLYHILGMAIQRMAMGWQSDCYIFQGLWFPYQVGWNGPGKEYFQLGRTYNSTLPYQKTFGPSSTYGVLGGFGQVCFFILSVYVYYIRRYLDSRIWAMTKSRKCQFRHYFFR